MTWCREATSHFLNQCWPSFMSPYDVTRDQWVITIMPLTVYLTFIETIRVHANIQILYEGKIISHKMRRIVIYFDSSVSCNLKWESQEDGTVSQKRYGLRTEILIIFYILKYWYWLSIEVLFFAFTTIHLPLHVHDSINTSTYFFPIMSSQGPRTMNPRPRQRELGNTLNFLYIDFNV